MPHSAAAPAQASSASPGTVSQRILVVEDMQDARDSLREMLQLGLGLEVDAAEDGARGLEMLQRRPYSVVVTDLKMPKLGGMKMIEEIQARRIPVTIIVTTGHGSIKDAVEAIRHGAYDFLTKPADPRHLTLLIQRALRERALQDEVVALRAQLQGRHSFQNVISRSQRMAEVFDLINNISDTTSTVLIIGETGTGKEQIAQAIHQASSPHRSGAMVAVNCAAIPETLLESELFGHEKGSFTGAIGQRKGRFEQANGGTLFLDEVGDIPLAVQVKLLRVLQERRIERVGGSESMDIDVRVIAATHQELEKLVKEGKFREDLFYRLNVIRIEIPPLRERPEDIPVLAAHFAHKFSRTPSPPQFSPDAMEMLTRCTWPGNVRQLENAIERACVTARDGVIEVANLPPDVLRTGESRPHPLRVDLSRPLPEQLGELTAAYEERYIRKALRKTRGHVGKCAELSGLSRRSITEKITLYKIDKDEFKNA